MTSEQHTGNSMFVDEPGTGLVISGLRRYNLFTAVFFLGRQGRLLREFVERSGAQPGEDALDIGCGPGKLVRALGRRVGENGTVTGVDPSEEAIAYNQRRDPRHRYLRSTAQELPLADAAFDVVTCTFVMHHIPEEHREAALSEMWRVLRPGGRLLLADVHPSAMVRSVFARSDRLRRRDSADRFAVVDIRRYTTALRRAGFDEPEFVAGGHSTGMLISVKPR
ncbi:class I SAM-dependent methyltransferase [Nocardia sp. X0981]